jgi:competence protein ComFC
LSIRNKLKQVTVLNHKIHYFTLYTPDIASLLFRYKEHGDVPLGGCIFYPYKKILKDLMKDSVAVIVPSSTVKTAQRGFHPLKYALEMVDIIPFEILEKESNDEQKKKNKKDRSQTKFSINSTNSLPCQKIVLFDDVLTSGHSLLTCKQLLELYGYQVTLCVFAINSSWL